MRTALLLAALLATASPLSAQVSKPDLGALRLVRAERLQSGAYSYQYQVVHSGKIRDVWSDVFLDVSAPKRAEKPKQLGHKGSFLFDATADSKEAQVAHAPIGVATPANWFSAIWYTGSIAWTASRYADGVNHGVRYGRAVGGFGVVSTGLPAFRRYDVQPHRPFASVDAADEPVRVDSTWVILSGYVLAPGWDRDQVTGTYLRDQVEAACFARALARCGTYRAIVVRVLEAEEQFSDRAFRAAVRLFQDHLKAEASLSPSARMVFVPTLQALYEAPPSRRAALTR